MHRGRSNSYVTTLSYCPCQGAQVSQEDQAHQASFQLVRENVQDGDIDISKVHMDLNVADPLTKPLPRAKHDQHQNSMGVRFITM